ncbi:BLUF domain-containing protein [Flavobacterium sp.]|uniref:BLUF domain-containing protein n=1 Tax=Flavobacterium sp. TaxID=239 RepID=UPI002FDE01FF
MHRIIYLSSGIKIFSDEEINDLLKVSRNNNQKNGITGLLLYSDGNFMQILEGEKEAVEITYKKIVNDNRHRNIIVVANESVKKRNFSEWKMGYSVVDPEFLKKHPEINPFELKTSSEIDLLITTFIDTFLNSFRNKVLYH